MMKFVLVAALVALYWATPTLGLKCYQCRNKGACDEFEKLSPDDKKADKWTDDCKEFPQPGLKYCVTMKTSVNEETKTCVPDEMDTDIKGEKNPKLKNGCDNAWKLSGKTVKICACDTDYCNLEKLIEISPPPAQVTQPTNTKTTKKSTSSPSTIPSIFMLGFAVVVTFLNAKVNAQ